MSIPTTGFKLDKSHLVVGAFAGLGCLLDSLMGLQPAAGAGLTALFAALGDALAKGLHVQ